MKSTRLKISVSQDGLLPQETAEIATLEFPTLPKKLLKALGFERVDAKTYVGVLPVFINLGEKDQEIEIELGVTLPEMRKKIIEIVKTPARLIAVARDNETAVRKPRKKAEPKTQAAKAEPKSKAAASRAKPKAEPKTTSKTKTTAKSTAKTAAKTTAKSAAKSTTKTAAKATSKRATKR